MLKTKSNMFIAKEKKIHLSLNMIFDKVLDGSAEVRVDSVVLIQDGRVQGGVVSEDRHQLDMIN